MDSERAQLQAYEKQIADLQKENERLMGDRRERDHLYIAVRDFILHHKGDLLVGIKMETAIDLLDMLSLKETK